MKKAAIFIILLFFITAGSGCSSRSKIQKFSHEFTGAFDTIIQFVAYGTDEEEFLRMAEMGQKKFEELHRLFDIYHNYKGINNIKTINDMAGKAPVKVERVIIDLISFSIEWHKKTDGAVNIALGPVLAIWHSYMEEGIAQPDRARIPDIERLRAANEKTDIDRIQIDYENNTVMLEEGMRLDVGAVAKGYATELVVNELKNAGYDSFIISSGGNIRTVGAPGDGKREKWAIGIQDPDGNPYIPNRDLLDIVYVTDAAVVTSGDYQRYYIVDGERMHHIIDPATLMPARRYRAVTVIAGDSGLADFLSTTLFVLPYEKGRELVDSLDGVEAIWVVPGTEPDTSKVLAKTYEKLAGSP